MHEKWKFDACASDDTIEVFQCCEETYQDNKYFIYDCQYELSKKGCDNSAEDYDGLCTYYYKAALKAYNEYLSSDSNKAEEVESDSSVADYDFSIAEIIGYFVCGPLLLLSLLFLLCWAVKTKCGKVPCLKKN